MKRALFLACLAFSAVIAFSQINTDRVLTIGRNALYFEDYALSIQYFNQVIKAKPWLAEPYFYRAVAKINLEDYRGADEDASLCLQRNPFFAQAWFARGIARQNLENYDEAIADYNKGLEFSSNDQQMLLNKAIACIQKKDYASAEQVFEQAFAAHPNYAMYYLARGSMLLEKGDSLQALNDYNRAINLDPYFPQAYGQRALVHYQMSNFQQALADLNEAIRLNNRESAYFINRGLVRYQMNDLHGAMDDYDLVISFDKHNLIARFNRALLRAQVGDNNRAIDDFDDVLLLEPDNYIARYNRALLRIETGNFPGAIDDLDDVLAQYPDFFPAYLNRADAKRKLHDNAGADRDYWTAIQTEERLAKQPRDTTTTADNKTTREQSDNSIDKFNRLVVYDQEDERKSKYQSDVRGKIQNRNVPIQPEPPFVLSYYEKDNPIKKTSHYDLSLENFNHTQSLPKRLLLTNDEAPLTEQQISQLFESINRLSDSIAQDSLNPIPRFARAIDFMLTQNLHDAINDYNIVLQLNPNFAFAFFNRAVVRTKLLQYALANTTDPASTPEQQAYERELIRRDYDKVLQLNPNFAFAFFNRANLLYQQRDFPAALQDYNAALQLQPDFPEALFNRALTHLAQGNTQQALADLSAAGQLGIINAYPLLKRLSTPQ